MKKYGELQIWMEAMFSIAVVAVLPTSVIYLSLV